MPKIVYCFILSVGGLSVVLANPNHLIAHVAVTEAVLMGMLWAIEYLKKTAKTKT